ncbi:MAG: hypothetical protein KJ626_07295 [Verrucomicrobia bacterium]|nr:hypothetical protein [Verrucomicrobiota bacterium]
MIIADTHVHFYDGYDAATFFTSAVGNLNRLAGPAADKVLFLAERADCDFFSSLRKGKFGKAGLSVKETASPLCLRVDIEGGPVWVVAGRQVATLERLEVLCLCTANTIADGLPVAEVLDAAVASGAVPVLTWALGKWTGRRRAIVAGLIEVRSPEEFLIGDTTMRPRFLPEPSLFGTARRRGFQIVAGTDPLPVSGEEKMAGRYAVAADVDFKTDDPESSLRSFLRDRAVERRLLGNRCCPAQVLKRWFRARS